MDIGVLIEQGKAGIKPEDGKDNGGLFTEEQMESPLLKHFARTTLAPSSERAAAGSIVSRPRDAEGVRDDYKPVTGCGVDLRKVRAAVDSGSVARQSSQEFVASISADCARALKEYAEYEAAQEASFKKQVTLPW